MLLTIGHWLGVRILHLIRLIVFIGEWANVGPRLVGVHDTWPAEDADRRNVHESECVIFNNKIVKSQTFLV